MSGSDEYVYQLPAILECLASQKMGACDSEKNDYPRCIGEIGFSLLYMVGCTPSLLQMR